MRAPCTCTMTVRKGKPSLGSRSPVVCDLYQLLPAAAVKYTYMKTAFKVIAIATAIVVACLIVHYCIGTFSY